MNLLLFVVNLLSFVMFFAKSDVCGYRTLDHRFCLNLRSLREIFFAILDPGSVRLGPWNLDLVWPKNAISGHVRLLWNLITTK
jgi:hypothetical protein